MNRSLADARLRVLALETVAELRAVLEDVYEETAIRHLAAQRLGQLGEAGLAALQGAFTAAKENPPGRVAALQALVRYFPKESEATLLEALDDAWPRVRRSAYLFMKERNIRRRRSNFEFLPSSDYKAPSLSPPSPLPANVFEIYSRQLFDQDEEMVRQAIQALKWEANPEVGVLFWILADEHRHPREVRQLAHNELEFWRRYNGRGKQ